MPFVSANRATPIAAIPPDPETGTAVAIYNSSKSARPFNDIPRLSTHGGARNRADRTSDCLTQAQVVSVLRTIRRASELGLPFNRHWTVHWGRAGVDDRHACAAIGALMTLVRDWLRKQTLAFACAWVRENDMGDGSKGSHVHILLHLPEGVRWCGWRVRRWIERVSGQHYVKGTSRTRIIGGSVKSARTSPDAYRANLASVAAYVLKGADNGAVTALGLDRQEVGGRVVGKRWGRSQNVALGQ